VAKAAVLYVFRTLIDDEIPMNAGCLEPLSQFHGVAVLVGLNGVRAAALAETKAHRCERVPQDVAL